MKKSLIFSAALIVCALVLLLFGFDAFIPLAPLPAGPTVLVVQDDTGAFLMQVKQGAQKAAAQVGSELSLETVTAASVEQAAAKWADKGAEAALLLMEDEALAAWTYESFTAAGIPTVPISTEETRLPGIGADERQAGALLGAFARDYGRVYVFGDAPLRLEGVSGVLKKNVLVTDGTLPAPQEDACVLALTGEETLRLAGLKATGGFSAPVAGLDPGEERVRLMEEGFVSALVCRTPYAMGYAAASAIYEKQEPQRALPYRIVYRSDMYSAENVKLMFPLLH